MNQRAHSEGSVFVVAVFVLALITGIAISLAFLTQTEVRMSQADVRAKRAFFAAEAGLEDARATLYGTNGEGDFSDDILAAAGPNNIIDFDPDTVEATFDSIGNVTGFSGFGDDVPLRVDTAFESGRYIAFLTNDAVEGVGNTTDANGRIMVTAVGAVAGESVEVVQAILQQGPLLPTPPGAAITLLGPDPNFQSGNSNAKKYVGEDCDGVGVPNLFVPVVGTTSEDAEGNAEDGVNRPANFTSGPNTGLDTVANLSDPTEPTVISSGMGPIDPAWSDCNVLMAMLENARRSATTYCPRGTTCTLPTPSPNEIIFVDDDLVIGPNYDGEGVVFVTGELTMHGRASWTGMIFVIGEGNYRRSGGGNGVISGAMVMADVAGPDEVFGTSDDCTGGDAGLAEVLYDERGGGTGDLFFCTVSINAADTELPYKIVDFLQR